MPSSYLQPFLVIYRIILARRLMALSYTAGFLSYFVILPAESTTIRAVAAWDLGSFLYLATSFTRVIRTLGFDIRTDAKAHQEGEWSIFTLTVLSAIMSFASIFLFSKFTGTAHHKAGFLGFVCLTLILSWGLTQISFAYRYAHEYYSYNLGGKEIDGGIVFPGDEPPDYLDFIYFSVVLGMTFQVSDCNITSKKLRRLATVQGLVGFLFNTVILALAINIFASSL